MKIKHRFPAILTAATLALFGAGCATFEHALLTPHPEVTPASVTPVTSLTTNAAGVPETNVTLHVTPAVTNLVYEPNATAQATASALGLLPFPGAGTAAIVGGWLLTALAAYKNKKLSIALVQGIDAGRTILQTTPEGQKLDAKFKDALIDHQEVAGVLSAASALVNTYTGDTVKPAQ